MDHVFPLGTVLSFNLALAFWLRPSPHPLGPSTAAETPGRRRVMVGTVRELRLRRAPSEMPIDFAKRGAAVRADGDFASGDPGERENWQPHTVQEPVPP